MKLDGALPHSQNPATCPYREPDWSSPCPPSHVSKTHSNIIIPSSPSGLLTQVFPPKSCMQLSSPQDVPHSLSISVF
jgi:hypothetical protein